MRHTTGRRLQREQRGQSMVLSALSFLVLSLMMMMSFNLNQAIHSKIALQQNSDAIAYSKAVVQARALNYFAYSNRAIAASYVAMTTLHAYMSSVTVTSRMMKAAAYNMQAIAVEEAAQCSFWEPQHCYHAIQAEWIVKPKFERAATKYQNKARSLDGQFENAQSLLEKMVVVLHASQDLTMVDTTSMLNSSFDRMVTGYSDSTFENGSFGNVLNGNAPGSTESGTVRALNTAQFNCAIDGMPCAGQSSTSTTVHAQEMTEIANATRPEWVADRNASSPVSGYFHLSPVFLKDLMNSIQGNGFSTILYHSGTAKIVDQASPGALHSGSSGEQGKVVGADEHSGGGILGGIVTQWHDGASLCSYGKNGLCPGDAFGGLFGIGGAEVYSDSGNGSHVNGGHQGNHKFGGVNTQSLTACIASGNCFMKFRATDSRPDFGQPKSYGYTTQTLRNLASGSPGPWALGGQGKFSYTFGNRTSTLNMAGGDGAAFSKGMAYYHRIGDWQEMPNFFGPYWRAKLHPFTPQEASTILGAAGNSDAATIAASSGLPF